MVFRTGLFSIMAFLVLTAGADSSSDIKKMRALAEDFYFKMAEFDPVWGTEVGIHTYDSLFADISDEWRTDYNDFLQKELNQLNRIDTTGWSIDDRIDYALLKSDIENKARNIIDDYFNSKAIMTWPKKCNDGLYYLMARQSVPLEQRFSAIISRMKKIPDFLERSIGNVDSSSQISIHFGLAGFYGPQDLVKCCAEVMIDSFPGRNSYISTIRDRTIFSLDYYAGKYQDLYRNHIEEYQIGRDEFNRMLSEVYFLDFDVDSLKKIAETTYKEARELEYFYDSRANKEYPWASGSDVFIGPPEDSTRTFCYSEIDSIKQYLIKNKIITIPEKLGDLVLVNPETTGITEHARLNFYVGPGQLDSVRTGYYYTTFYMLDNPVGSQMPPEYAASRVRGDFIRSMIPGEHLQLNVAGNHRSLIRRMQRNDMMIEGWGLYMKEYLALRGLIGDDPGILRDIYKEIKTYAVGVILDIGRHCDKLSHDSLTVIYDNLGGSHPGGYSSQYHGYPYPERNLKFFLGRYLILQMRDKAKAKMGRKFDIRDFHDKILSEGCIPPALIAEKYGW